MAGPSHTGAITRVGEVLADLIVDLLEYSFLTQGSDSWVSTWNYLCAVNPGFSPVAQVSPCQASGESLGNLERVLWKWAHGMKRTPVGLTDTPKALGTDRSHGGFCGCLQHCFYAQQRGQPPSLPELPTRVRTADLSPESTGTSPGISNFGVSKVLTASSATVHVPGSLLA